MVRYDGILDKSVKLADKMRKYRNDDLHLLAENLGLGKLSRMNKEQMVEKITSNLLDPQNMFYRCSILSDERIKVFEKGMNGVYEYSEEERDSVGALNEMDLILCDGKGMVVPCDVAKVWSKINGDKFKTYQKKVSWIWKCLNWTEVIYGFAPAEIVLKVINRKKGFSVTKDELEEIYGHFPEDVLWIYRIDDLYISCLYLEEKQFCQLASVQDNKEYYIPTVKEVDELFNTSVLISEKPYQDMIRFLSDELQMNRKDAEYMVEDLWDQISGDEDYQEIIKNLLESLTFTGEKQIQRFISLMNEMWNNTRMIMNRGYTPIELTAKQKFGPGNMPVIVPGSSYAAKQLEQIAPEIQRMGFGLDLEGNAKKVSTTFFPYGGAKEAVTVEKKIYPNDPCPCGSGKKFKKCCGRN